MMGRLRFNAAEEGRRRRRFLAQEGRGLGGVAHFRTAHRPAAVLPGFPRGEEVMKRVGRVGPAS
jgi:hypothetical protein